MQSLCIDVGGSKFSVAGFNDSEIVVSETHVTDRAGGPEWMFGEIEKIYRRWRSEREFAPERAGIGFGGPVDFPSQTVTMSTHVSGWNSYPLVENVRQLTGAPTVMDNDANVGALGEAFYGAGVGKNPLFYMTLSTGIGGGIVIDGRVYRGADSFAGELGHMMIDPAGPACLCGSHGCFERMCCGLWLERDYGRPASELLQDSEFVRSYVVLLARGLKAAIMILNPDRIVIGGGISKAASPTARSHRRDRAVELSVADPGVQGAAGPARRQHHRRQAGADDSAVQPAFRGDGRGRAAEGRDQFHHGCQRSWRRADAPSRCAQDLVHRIDGDRSQGDGERGRDAEAHHAGIGGNDAGVVLDDADPATVAKGIFNGAFQNSGQVCLAIKRLYVHESIYDSMCDELAQLADAAIVDDGSKQGTQLGPLQNRMQYEKVKGFLDDARKHGTIIAGGDVIDRPGFFIRPTIVRDITEAAAWSMRNSSAPSCRC